MDNLEKMKQLMKDNESNIEKSLKKLLVRKKVAVVVREDQILFHDQKMILDQLGDWKEITVPISGWNLRKIDIIAGQLVVTHDIIVMAEAIPAMIVLLARFGADVRILHNDNHDETGWEII